ncbi:MAG: diheme cytochrome c-553, partial [bacterium]|nr:diheme cytochrome c-553 [bacterium]
TDRQIKVAVKLGQRANGAPMGPPMGYSYYQNIKDADMNAIIAYLRSLKPVRNEVKVRYIPPKKK